MDNSMFNKLNRMANEIRKNAIKIGHAAGYNGAHFGPGLSIIEIMATLYGGIMRFDENNPHWQDRDRFILSKGHGVLGYYPALAEVGMISFEELESFEDNGGILGGQPSMNREKGIEFTSGSLGMGLSQGIGVALAGRMRGKDYNVFVLMGDGECNEGSVWEAASSASHFKIDNLIAIIDKNGMQSDGTCDKVIEMDLGKKWDSFGFRVLSADGHDIKNLHQILLQATTDKIGKPTVIIAKTVKGKGISFMENNPAWHHGILNSKLYEQALEELP
jgi:transketolase